MLSPCFLPQRIQFARVKSDAITKREGSYIPRDKRKAVEDARPLEKRAAPAVAPADVVYVPAPQPKAVHLPPNKVLFAQNVPSDATDATLTRLFEPYGGFREARVHAHKGVGFVEFDNEAAATIAMQALNNFRLSDTHVLILSYAKK
jgi:U2 small nuclear ribonucleoprotein B''